MLDASYVTTMKFILILVILTGCETAVKYKNSLVDDGTTCKQSLEQVKKKTDIGSLNLIRTMYYRGCYEETLEAVNYARQSFRDSIFSVTKDAAELVAFEGTFISYTMESYERTYLALLAVRSYMKLHKNEDALIELRKAYNESVAQLETKGQDRITLLLMAALWESLGKPLDSEPLYRRIIEISAKNKDELYELAIRRLEQTDKKKFNELHIFELGALPEMSFFTQVEFKYPPYEGKLGRINLLTDYTYNMIPTCREKNMVVLSTQEWLRFLSDRAYNSDNAKYKIKKMARLPLAVFYSTTTFVAGAYVTAIMVKDDYKALLYGTALTVAATAAVFSRSMAPDLRYWDQLPQAMIISERDLVPYDLQCLDKFKEQMWLKPKKFL